MFQIILNNVFNKMKVFYVFAEDKVLQVTKTF